MKIAGKKVEAPKPTIVAFAREDGDLVFHVGAVLDFTPFEKICQEPKPTEVVMADGHKEFREDHFYQTNVRKYNKRRLDWMVLQSLKVTPGLEWERVNLEDPDTWELYEEELRETFNQGEINILISAVINANSANEDKMREAKERFLATRSQQST